MCNVYRPAQLRLIAIGFAELVLISLCMFAEFRAFLRLKGVTVLLSVYPQSTNIPL